MAKEQKETFIRVKSRTEDDGCIIYSHEGKDVAMIIPYKPTSQPGSVVDLREHPPFLMMSPCPYCGALEDKNHNPMAHVNPSLGTPI